MPNRRSLTLLLPALASAALLCACGGASHRTAARGKAAVSRGPYRWLVRTTGSQPTVAAENRQPGTGTWRLPGPADDVGGLATGVVRGYVAQETVAPGGLERIYADVGGARSLRIAIFRIGFYGGAGGREVLVSHRLPAQPQPPCAHQSQTGLTECDWRPSLSFRIPPALPTGVYIAKLSAATGASDCLFVVTASTPQPLLAQLPTSTYEAYNAWGGDSLYPGGTDTVGITGTTQGVEVSYDRPYDSVTGAGQFFARDVAMVRFLERYGYPVSYTTSEGVDGDPAQVNGHRALLDFGHSEYWSGRQASAFAAARDSGTSLLFLSSDTLAWRIRFAPASAASSERGAPDHTIVAYKEHAALDPDRAQPTGPSNQTAAALTGSAYLGCINPRISQPGPPTYQYYSWHPAPSAAPAWLFAGTGVTASTVIPGIVGYELDRTTPYSPAGTQVVGSGTTICMGETAPGEPVPPPGPGVAETTLYQAHSGAWVFATGTLGWELGLEPVPSASPQAPSAPNPQLVAITRNLLAHVLG